jgi:hypothetical protein
VKKYSPYQFSIFRIYTGAYLLYIFATAIPSAAAIWSSEGMVPHATHNLSFGVFPGLLNYFDKPIEVKFFLAALALLSAFFMLGVGRRWAALLLWYGLACLLNRNNMIINPSIPYLGWLLLASSLVPAGEPWALARQRHGWEMPRLIWMGAWILLAAGFFVSGIDKWQSASWHNGTALEKIMACPLGSLWSTEWSHAVSPAVWRLLTWLVVLMEMACLPLAIFAATRKYAWMLAFGIQLGIMAVLNIFPIVFGMFSLLIFTCPLQVRLINPFKQVPAKQAAL